ncbi:hypothetical protein GGS21DRAFT_531263 [Xylaria nigripes]|nr:hypothetical protein GGS21DRAFT_531263 [Xylaria nigripes]
MNFAAQPASEVLSVLGFLAAYLPYLPYLPSVIPTGRTHPYWDRGYGPSLGTLPNLTGLTNALAITNLRLLPRGLFSH